MLEPGRENESEGGRKAKTDGQTDRLASGQMKQDEKVPEESRD